MAQVKTVLRILNGGHNERTSNWTTHSNFRLSRLYMANAYMARIIVIPCRQKVR